MHEQKLVLYGCNCIYIYSSIFSPPPPHTHLDHVNGFNKEFNMMLYSKSKVHSLPTDFHPLFKNITLLHSKASII